MKETKKVFISHPMTNLSEKKVMEIREEAMAYLDEKYKDKYEFTYIDNYHHDDAPANAGSIWHLGRSIQQLDEADFIYFVPNYSLSEGCMIERLIVNGTRYRKEILE